MELPPSLVHAAHFTDIEVEDVASTAKMVGAAGTNVCVMTSENSIDQTFKVGCQTPPSYKKSGTHFKFHELVTELVEPSNV